MASYTANYQLHQWEPADFFLRTDFNADFAKLDAALAGKAGLADLAEKLGAVTGSYTGDGSAGRTISLGFAPIAVFLREDEDSGAILAVQKALADSVKILNEACPNDQVIKLKALEAMQKVADGQATKIVISSELQGLAGLATSIKEFAKD